MPSPNKWREKGFADELFGRLELKPTDWSESERPDCHFKVDGKHVGMEITESTPAEKYWGADIVKKHAGGTPTKPTVYATSNLRNHGRQRTKDELFHDMFNNENYVDMGDAHKWWCEAVKQAWVKKRLKLNEVDYLRYDENWLLIWDNEGLGDDRVTLENIPNEVRRTQFHTQGMIEFDHVFVLSGNYTFDFNQGKVAFLHERAEEVNGWLDRIG